MSEPLASPTKETKETKKRFALGGRYVLRGLRNVRVLVGWEGFQEWRDESDYPRAGILDVDGEVFLVADVVRLLFDGVVDVIGIPPEHPHEEELAG